jgi:phosphoglycolate/pyridoxal phosphate phosphatase family enzyme
MTLLVAPHSVYEAYLFDLDGTVCLGEELLPLAGESIQRLRALGCRVLFVSNNPTQPAQEYARKLTRLGLPTAAADVINSSQVMVSFLQERMPGARLFVVGEAPLCRELEAAGFTLTAASDEVAAVIASFDRTFTYHKLQAAFDAIRAGAHFFATNGDRFCPVPGGGQPDAAAMIAAITACTGKEVEAIVGKPSRHMAEAALSRLGVPPERCLMVGDRLETDVQMGLTAGMATALVLTGATPLAALEQSAIKPTYVIRHLDALLWPHRRLP